MNAKSDRIPADERRVQILDAAVEVFGRYGYAAATTDRVAKGAGISQPYVVRMFGTKEQLFIETLGHTLARLLRTFRAALAEADAEGLSAEARRGAAYLELVGDRGVLLTLLHGFMMGADPAIGPVARGGFFEVYRMLRQEAGFTPEQARSFLAEGMLINTLIGLDVRPTDDLATAELLACTFGDDVPESFERSIA